MSLEAVDTWHERYGVPNAAAAVVTDAGVVETAGDTTRGFHLASVTKLFSATAVMIHEKIYSRYSDGIVRKCANTV